MRLEHLSVFLGNSRFSCSRSHDVRVKVVVREAKIGKLRRREPSCLNLAGWTRDEPWFRVELEAADSWAQLFLGNSINWALIGRRRMESRCRAEEDKEETDHCAVEY
jgi:hypothetical protein